MDVPAASAVTPEALVARYRSTGDPAALGALFDATAPGLFRVALSIAHDATAAEDALQETYIAALEHLDRYDDERPFVPWLVGILRVMVKRSRRDAARVPDPVRVAAAQGVESESDGPAEKGEDAQRVRTAIEGLSEPYRSVALLRWRYGLSPAEIADVRAEPPGTVRSLLSRATERLREVLRGAPAFFLLPSGPRGLDHIKAAVLRKAATMPLPATATAAAAAGAAGLSSVAKAWLIGAAAAAAVVAAGAVGWSLRSSGDGVAGTGDAAQTREGRPAAGPKSAEPVAAGASAPTPVTPPSTTPKPEEPSGTKPAEPPAVEPAKPDVALPANEPEAAKPPSDGPDARPTHEPEKQPLLPEKPPVEMGNDPNGAPKEPQASSPTSDADPSGVSKALNLRIGDAIARGAAWLKSAQRADGSWGYIEGNAAYGAHGPAAAASSDKAYMHPAGPTALALYALIKSGVPLDDPFVKRGFSYLRTKQRIPQGAYELSATLLAVTATADPFHEKKPGDVEKPKFPSGEWRDWAQKLHDALLDKRRAAKSKGWRYMLPGVTEPAGGNADLSSTQLAALALLSADRCGLRTDARLWSDLLEFALAQQEKDGPTRPRVVVVRQPASKEGTAKPGETPAAGQGTPTDRARGFAYILDASLPPDEGRPTGGMTACGIGTVEIARQMLAERGKLELSTDAEARRAVFDGLAWLDLHWSAFKNPEKKEMNVYHVAYLYAVERAFDLLGNRRVGKHFWFAEMAEQLLARQAVKGFWDSESAHKPQEVLDTSFALLFLSRATKNGLEPVLTDPSDSTGADHR